MIYDTFVHFINGLALSSADTNHNNIHISNMKVVLLLFADDTALFCVQMVYKWCKINCKNMATFGMFLSTRKAHALFFEANLLCFISLQLLEIKSFKEYWIKSFTKLAIDIGLKCMPKSE